MVVVCRTSVNRSSTSPPPLQNISRRCRTIYTLESHQRKKREKKKKKKKNRETGRRTERNAHQTLPYVRPSRWGPSLLKESFEGPLR
ncbi:unnamed protein product, partial [Nesidiocoris tenuis]